MREYFLLYALLQHLTTTWGWSNDGTICGSFTDKWVESNESGALCFKYHKEPTTWYDAKRICEAEAGQIVQVTDWNMDEFLNVKEAGVFGDYYWIDGSNKGGSGWKWTDGGEMKYFNFRRSTFGFTWESMLAGDGDLCVLKGTVHWIMKRCFMFAPFMCQLTSTSGTGKPEDKKRQKRRTFIASRMGGKQNAKLVLAGMKTTTTTDLIRCVRLCSAHNECLTLTFCEEVGSCVLYNNYNGVLSGGATAEAGCSFYVDIDYYKNVTQHV